MLSKTEIALKIDQKHSEYFDIFKGVKQGDSISPTRFNIFINDLSASFNTEECKPPELLNSRVGSLAFADDLLIISESKEGLQNSVNKLNMFCDNWQLTLNVKKTKAMAVQQNTSQVSPFIDFKGDVIQNVTEYKLLGCLFKYNGNLRHSLEELAKTARKF
jgi:phage terminase small subunit